MADKQDPTFKEIRQMIKEIWQTIRELVASSKETDAKF